MKTFDEAVKKYMTLPDRVRRADIKAWQQTIVANEDFVGQMREAAQFILLDLAASSPERVLKRLEAWMVSQVLIGMMIGIDMEKLEL